MAMSTWTAEDYSKYDSYLIKKWQIGGWCDDDSVYVVSFHDISLTCFVSCKKSYVLSFTIFLYRVLEIFTRPAAFTARTFYKFERIIHGRPIPTPPQNTPLPDLSRMHLWTDDEYDLSLMNKWRISGCDESEATYAGRFFPYIICCSIIYLRLLIFFTFL